MTFRLVDKAWDSEIAAALPWSKGRIRIVCPFIKKKALQRILSHNPHDLRVITRFDTRDLARHVSDLEALRDLLDIGAGVHGIRNLHAKLYVFGSGRAIVTSANLTEAALTKNVEFGMVTEDADAIGTCHAYFDDLWRRSGPDLSAPQLDAWTSDIDAWRQSGGRLDRLAGLRDFGADLGVPAAQTLDPAAVPDTEQAFIKFLGRSSERELTLDRSIGDVVARSGCHWALGYPSTRRPRQVQNDAVMFIGRHVKGGDVRIFGRAFGRKHDEETDNATEEEIRRSPTKRHFCRYIRVYDAKFLAGTLANSVPLSELKTVLGTDAFEAGYNQQPHARLSIAGHEWLAQRLQDAFEQHGPMSRADYATLEWPPFPAPTQRTTGNAP